MVLACSRHMFVRPTLVMDQGEWTAAHVEAFAFFGGVPARLVPENVPRNIFRSSVAAPRYVADDGMCPVITGVRLAGVGHITIRAMTAS